MELGKRTYSAATPESDTSCDVFGEGKTKMRKKPKMGGRDAVDMLQPIVEGDGNSVLHGRPWGFFGPPVPLPGKNCTRSRRRGKFTATGAGPLWDPLFPQALRVTGFQAITSIWI